MIILNIDFKKIDQSRLKKTASGSYGDLVLVDHPSERNGIKSDGFVKQGVSKEERAARVEMPILGSWRKVGGERQAPQGQSAQATSHPPARPPVDEGDGEDIPF